MFSVHGYTRSSSLQVMERGEIRARSRLPDGVILGLLFLGLLFSLENFAEVQGPRRVDLSVAWHLGLTACQPCRHVAVFGDVQDPSCNECADGSGEAVVSDGDIVPSCPLTTCQEAVQPAHSLKELLQFCLVQRLNTKHEWVLRA